MQTFFDCKTPSAGREPPPSSDSKNLPPPSNVLICQSITRLPLHMPSTDEFPRGGRYRNGILACRTHSKWKYQTFLKFSSGVALLLRKRSRIKAVSEFVTLSLMRHRADLLPELYNSPSFSNMSHAPIPRSPALSLSARTLQQKWGLF